MTLLKKGWLVGRSIDRSIDEWKCIASIDRSIANERTLMSWCVDFVLRPSISPSQIPNQKLLLRWSIEQTDECAGAGADTARLGSAGKAINHHLLPPPPPVLDRWRTTKDGGACSKQWRQRAAIAETTVAIAVEAATDFLGDGAIRQKIFWLDLSLG